MSKFIKVKQIVHSEGHSTIEILLSITAIISLQPANFLRTIQPILYNKKYNPGIILNPKRSEDNYEYIKYSEEKTIIVEAVMIYTSNERYYVENSIAEIEEMIKNA